ncbi:hypothetical protein V6Z12_D05G364400 [Gossypium hirsutum]
MLIRSRKYRGSNNATYRWVLEEACATWAVVVRSCMEIVTATWDNGGVDLLLTVSVSAVCFLGVMGLGLGPSVLGQGYLGNVMILGWSYFEWAGQK